MIWAVRVPPLARALQSSVRPKIHTCKSRPAVVSIGHRQFEPRAVHRDRFRRAFFPCRRRRPSIRPGGLRTEPKAMTTPARRIGTRGRDKQQIVISGGRAEVHQPRTLDRDDRLPLTGAGRKRALAIPRCGLPIARTIFGASNRGGDYRNEKRKKEGGSHRLKIDAAFWMRFALLGVDRS
jgi:hypothetical protein